MYENKDFKFEVSLSSQNFSDKRICGAMIGSTQNKQNREIRKEYGFSANKGISFNRTTLTSTELLDDLLNGKVFCNLFQPEHVNVDGSFGISEKKDDNFVGSSVLCVDIDHTNYTSINEYVDSLTLTPTFYHTTYNNLQSDEDGNFKGLRFRLVYVLDQTIEQPLYFRYCVDKLNKIIEKDTNEPITDDCNLRCSQYFNGTCITNPSLNITYGSSDLVYNLSDIQVSDNDYVDYLCDYCGYKTITTTKTKEIQNELYRLANQVYAFDRKTHHFVLYGGEHVPSTTTTTIDYSSDTHKLLYEWDSLDEEHFKKSGIWNYLRNLTKYVYRVENKMWVDGLYQKIDDGYFKLMYYPKTRKDGEKRRRTLFQRMCLRRVIQPSITKDEMVVNTIIDILKFFDRYGQNNSDDLNSSFIKRNIDNCFDMSIEDIMVNYNDSIEYLKRTTRPKKGFIYFDKAAKGHVIEHLLKKHYDPDLTVQQNIDKIADEEDYSMTPATVYRVLKELGFKISSHKLSDDELLNIIDDNMSRRENLQFLKDNDIKCGNNRLARLLRLKKSYTC